MINRYIEVECDNCGKKKSFINIRISDIYTTIRCHDWAVSKDREFTFCPKCKCKVTSTGRNGVNKLLPFSAKKQRYIERQRRYEEEERAREHAIYLEECAEFEEMNR